MKAMSIPNFTKFFYDIPKLLRINCEKFIYFDSNHEIFFLFFFLKFLFFLLCYESFILFFLGIFSSNIYDILFSSLTAEKAVQKMAHQRV